MKNIKDIDESWTGFQKIVILIIVLGLIWFMAALVINHEMKKILEKESIDKEKSSLTNISELDTICSIQLPGSHIGKVLTIEMMNKAYEESK